MKIRLTACAAAAFVLAGCSSVSLTQKEMQTKTEERSKTAVRQFEDVKPVAAVREVTGMASNFRKTEQTRVRGDVNIRAAAVPFAPVLSELGRKAGYTVAYSEGVDANRKITVDFVDALTDDAIRTTAFLAGYAAVINKQQRTIMVADTATYTFKLPAGLFSELQATYTVGGNPSSSAGSSGGGSGGGGSSGGSSLKAEFSISGKEGSNPQSLTKYLNDMAGRNSEVYVSESGHISVRGNAQALRRIHDFMRGFVKDAMTQVEIEASVVEVSLTKEFALGIQWGKVIDRASGNFLGAATNGSTALMNAFAAPSANSLMNLSSSAGSAGSLSSFRVSNSSATLINALAQFTDINIVSQPKLLSMNNVPATFFDGTQLPYLGSIQQTAGTAAGSQPTVTGSVAFAIDGVSFSAIPSVVDNQTVQITLIPVLSSVSGFSEFLGGALKAPRQSNKQTYMRVLAESGKTLILGGIRYNKDSRDTSVLTSTGSTTTAKEVVILLRANVIPAPHFDPIVNESL